MEAATGSGNEPTSVASSRPRGEGHGHELTRALEALEVFPAFTESRDRLLRLAGEPQPSIGGMVARSSPTPRSRSPSCAWLTRGQACMKERWQAFGTQSRYSAPWPSRRSPNESTCSISSSAPPFGVRRPSTSAFMRSLSSGPLTASHARFTPIATSSAPLRSCTTWANSCSCRPTRGTRSRFTATRAHRRRA